MPAHPPESAAKIRFFKSVLDEYLARYYKSGRVQSDPVRCVHEFRSKKDIEIAAFLTAPLAYGRAESIICSSDRVLKALGKSPYEAVGNFDKSKDARHFQDFVHRFTSQEDMLQFIELTSLIVGRHGSLKKLFLRFDSVDEPVKNAMIRFVDHFRSGTRRLRPHLRYMLPSPADKSACKRFNLFLRWMVRPADGVDFGLWPEVGKHRLIIPLDTHVGRISRELGLLKRKSSDLKAAEELTGILRKIDPEDPIRYDFALAHLGMTGDWKKISPDMPCG